MIKRAISLLMSIVMVLSMLPLQALAAEIPEEDFPAPVETLAITEETEIPETSAPEEIPETTAPETTSADWEEPVEEVSQEPFFAEVSDFTYTVLNGTYCEISGYTGTDTELTIPDVLGGIQTFSIDSNAGWRVRSNTVLTWDRNQGNTIQLGAHVYPYYGNNNGRNAIQDVKWTSSAKAVAAIDENGCVTCLKPGTAAITATAADGSGKKISFKLTVVKTITSLEMANQSVVGGKSLNLTKLITINPTDATNKNLDWQIVGGDTSGVTLSKGVLKTPKVTAARILTIRATATDGSGKYVQFSVIVNPT